GGCLEVGLEVAEELARLDLPGGDAVAAAEALEGVEPFAQLADVVARALVGGEGVVQLVGRLVLEGDQANLDTGSARLVRHELRIHAAPGDQADGLGTIEVRREELGHGGLEPRMDADEW